MIDIKSDGVNRSNIFGITKDNHYNAVCLVLRRAAFRLSQSIAPPFTCVLFDIILSSLPSFENLQWQPACSAAVEGGGRMYPISINFKGWSRPACVRVCTCLLEYKWNTLCRRGGVAAVGGAPSVDLLWPLGSWPVAAHSTLQICDLWIMYKNDYLHMGNNSKIRPIFVLYEWCSVIFL